MDYSDFEKELTNEMDFLKNSFLINFSWKIKGRYDAYTFFLKALNKTESNRSEFIDLILKEILRTKHLMPFTRFKNTPEKISKIKNNNRKYLKSKMRVLINLLIDYLDVSI